MKKILLLLTCAVMVVSVAAAAPAMVDRVWFYPGIDGFSMGIVGNSDNDDVVVLYNTYCDRNGDVDQGLFVTPPADVKVGDVLPVPEDYTPRFNFPYAPSPANAGTVAYVGKPKSEPLIEINRLEPGTQYFVAVYSRNADGEFSAPYYTGTNTYLQYPYTSDNNNFPCGYLPYGWYSDTDVKFIDKLFWDEKENKVTQGTNPIQQFVEISSTTQGTPIEVTLELPLIYVNTYSAVKFLYNIRKGTGQAYNDWAEGDVLAIRVSTDGGTSWESIKEYTKTDHKTQNGNLDYVDITAHLLDYNDKILQIQLYWKTYATNGSSMTVDSVSINEMLGAFVEYDKVTGLEADVTSLGAEGKAVLKWNAVENAPHGYELAHRLADAEDWLYGHADENIITLGYLTPGATYVWKVRVSTSAPNQYSEYSEEAMFTMPKNSSVAAIGSETGKVTVVTAEGVVVLRNAEPAALSTLPDGFYIVNGKKYLLDK